jgi:dipeptidyl aminopeptidase/acylaminoacyl peptidase
MLNDLRNFDATDFLSSIVSPIQVVHGTEDPRISYESSIKVMDVINSGKELVLIEGANHSYKDNEDHRKQVFEKSCEWFKKYL